ERLWPLFRRPGRAWRRQAGPLELTGVPEYYARGAARVETFHNSHRRARQRRRFIRRTAVENGGGRTRVTRQSNCPDHASACAAQAKQLRRECNQQALTGVIPVRIEHNSQPTRQPREV